MSIDKLIRIDDTVNFNGTHEKFTTMYQSNRYVMYTELHTGTTKVMTLDELHKDYGLANCMSGDKYCYMRKEVLR